MIDWVHQEEGYCEGYFKSVFFRDDEKNDIFAVMASRPDSSEYAEKCVEAFNSLTETIIYEICKEIIYHVNNEEDYEGEYGFVAGSFAELYQKWLEWTTERVGSAERTEKKNS